MISALDKLTSKYQTVLDLMPELGVRVHRVELHGEKLLIQAEAPSLEMKNRVWDQISVVDPMYPDLLCQITVNPRLTRRVISPALIEPGMLAHAADETYIIQPGDTLAGISHRYYGDSKEARKILEANRERIADPERLPPGVIITIPL
jgi:hypothetical protein